MFGASSALTIDVIVPTYDNLVELKACLAALARQQTHDFKVLVCVDGSIDGTLAYLRESRFPFGLTVLQHPDRANHGRAAARNLALPHLTSEYVLLLDSDMRFAPDALAKHLEPLSQRDCVSVGDVVYLNASENLWARYIGTRGKNKSRPGAEIRPLDFVTANTAMRTEDLLAVGGFDESLTGYGGEDTELALRLVRDRRLRFVFNPAARAETVEDKTIEQGLAELRRYARTNLRAIRQRHPDPPAPFWVDRLESRRLRDRALRACLNPLTDRVVDLLLPITPFAIQRLLLNYKVVRAVFAGYAEGAS